MDEKIQIDDRVLDRLVDGELSAGERRELLASLEHVPGGWRRCALSFLEAQSWRDNLGELVRKPSGPHAVPIAVFPPAQTAAPIQDRSGRRGVGWLAIAASLFLAFALGTVVRNGDRVPLADENAARNGLQVADIVPPPAGAVDENSGNADALTLFVRDDTGRTRPLRVPLVDAGALEQQLGLQFQSGVPADVRNKLQTRGFNVQSKQRYAPLWLENGRPMFVPVEDTKIVPVSQNVY